MFLFRICRGGLIFSSSNDKITYLYTQSVSRVMSLVASATATPRSAAQKFNTLSPALALSLCRNTMFIYPGFCFRCSSLHSPFRSSSLFISYWICGFHFPFHFIRVETVLVVGWLVVLSDASRDLLCRLPVFFTFIYASSSVCFVCLAAFVCVMFVVAFVAIVFVLVYGVHVVIRGILSR